MFINFFSPVYTSSAILNGTIPLLLAIEVNLAEVGVAIYYFIWKKK